MGRYRLFAAFAFLWLAAAALGVARGGFAPWFLAGSLGVLLLYALLIPALCLRGTSGGIRLSKDRVAAGETVQVKIDLRFTSWFPLPWLTVRGVWKDGAGRERYRSTRLLYPGRRRSAGCRYVIRDIDRGIYRLDYLELITGDLFGLLTVVKRLPLEAVLTALPVPFTPALSGGWSGTGGAPLAEGRGTPGTEPAAAVRDYQPGDPLRLIHWPATARTGSLKSAEPAPERPDRVYVLLAGGRAERFEAEVSAAAGLLAQAAASGARLGFACGGQLRAAAGPASTGELYSAGQWDELLTALAGLIAPGAPGAAAESGQPALAEALRQPAADYPPGSRMYVVAADPDERLAADCGELARNRRVALIHVLDREEEQAAGAPRWEAEFIRRGCSYRAVLLPSDGKGGVRHGGIA